MNGNTELYNFMLDNIQKIIIPEEINAIGLSISRLELLALLFVARLEAMTMGNLAQSMVVPMSTATGIADRLVKKGLLKRGGSLNDRRVVTVLLTDKGHAFVDGLQEHFHEFLGRVRGVLTEEEFQQALQLIKKVIIGLQKDKPTTANQTTKQRRNIVIE